MKKNIFLLIILLGVTLTAFCQTDKIYLHNGRVINGNVIENGNFTIIYNYAGEKTRQVISKYAVEKIIHGGSNREEIITAKIIVNTKKDWEKVVVLEDKTEITGLTKASDIQSSGGGEFSGAENAQLKAFKEMKQIAAENECPFVYVTNTITKSQGLRGQYTKIVKYGIAYRY